MTEHQHSRTQGPKRGGADFLREVQFMTISKNRKSELATILEKLLDTRYTRQEWSEILGISEAAISQWVNDKTIPRPEVLRMVLDTLSASASIPSKLLEEFQTVARQPATRISPYGARIGNTLEEYLVQPVFDGFVRNLRPLSAERQEQILFEGASLCRSPEWPKDAWTLRTELLQCVEQVPADHRASIMQRLLMACRNAIAALHGGSTSGPCELPVENSAVPAEPSLWDKKVALSNPAFADPFAGFTKDIPYTEITYAHSPEAPEHPHALDQYALAKLLDTFDETVKEFVTDYEIKCSLLRSQVAQLECALEKAATGVSRLAKIAHWFTQPDPLLHCVPEQESKPDPTPKAPGLFGAMGGGKSWVVVVMSKLRESLLQEPSISHQSGSCRIVGAARKRFAHSGTGELFVLKPIDLLGNRGVTIGRYSVAERPRHYAFRRYLGHLIDPLEAVPTAPPTRRTQYFRTLEFENEALVWARQIIEELSGHEPERDEAIWLSGHCSGPSVDEQGLYLNVPKFQADGDLQRRWYAKFYDPHRPIIRTLWDKALVTRQPEED